MKGRGLILFAVVLCRFCQGQNLLPTTIVKAKAGLVDYNKTAIDSSKPAQITFDIQGKPVSKSTIYFTDTSKSVVRKEIKFDAGGDKTKEYYSTKNATSFTLFIAKPSIDIVGDYILEIDGKVQVETKLQTKPIIQSKSKPKRGLEKDSITLQCTVKAYPQVKNVTWKYPNNLEIVEGDSRVEFREKDGTGNGELRVLALNLTDDGGFRCEAKNALGSDELIIDVKVKDRWAALWPFIGILIEVAVLVVAILFYEKKRSKAHSAPEKNNVTSQELANNTDAEQKQALTAHEEGNGGDAYHRQPVKA